LNCVTPLFDLTRVAQEPEMIMKQPDSRRFE